MPYDSPATIRRRQNSKDAPRRRARSTQSIRVSSDEEWDRACDFHLFCIRERAEAGAFDAAGRHAQSLVQMALIRRAHQIMRDHGRAYWKAMMMARIELLGPVD